MDSRDVPGRLAELVDRLRAHTDGLILHDPDGPAECVVRAGELVATPDAAEDAVRQLGARVDRMVPRRDADLVRILLRPNVRERSVELAAELADSPVAPNHVHFGCPIMFGTPTPLEPAEAALPAPPADELWHPAITVALLDTGLDPHPWFAGRPWFSSWGVSPEVLCPGAPPDANIQAGHGTFVAGVLLRHAPGVTVRHHRTLSSLGLTDDVTVAGGLRRVRRLAAERREQVDLVVLTAGCHTADDRCPPVLRREVERCLTDRMTVLASAGNNAGVRPFWPAALPTVIGVAATGPDGELADFSNRGDWVDAAAPGVDVVSSHLRLDPDEGVAPDTTTRIYGAARWSGTSFATPKVAADIAQLLRFGMRPTVARQTVCENTRPS